MIGDGKRAIAAAEVSTLRQLISVHEQAAKEHANRLEDLLARYRAVIDAALDCVVVMDETGTVIEFNDAAEATFGYTRKDAIGAQLSDLILPPALREAHRAGLRRFLRTGVAHVIGRRIEVPALRADGAELLVELAITAVDTQAGQFFTGYMRDITESKRAQTEIEQLLHDQELLLNAAGDGIYRIDPEGVTTFVNPAGARMLGFAPEELIGSVMHDKIHHTRPDGTSYPREECGAWQTLQSGQVRRINSDVFWRKNRTAFPVEYIAAPIRESGRYVGVAVTFRDTTERIRTEIELKEARDRFEFLSRTADVLSSTLDYHSALQLLAREVVPKIGDWCAIDLLEGDELVRIAVHHTDPNKIVLVNQLSDRYPPRREDPIGPWTVLSTGSPHLYPHVDSEQLASIAHDDEHLRLMLALDVHSAFTIPLQAADRVLGVITIATAESRRVFDQEDVQFGMEIGRRAAVAVQNALLFQERSQVAATLQQSLLPPILPVLPGMDIGARYVAGAEGLEVGGDFYDLFSLGDDEWGIVIGDVCGKGAPAAALTALARYTLRAAAMETPKPAAVLARVNDAILSQSPAERFCTLVYANLMLGKNSVGITLTCAGHPLPLVLRGERFVERIGRPGTALGITESPRLTEQTTTLERGDTLILFTDGVIESLGPDGETGEEVLVRALERMSGDSPDAIAGGITDLVLHQRAGKPRDDMAVLAVRFVGELP